MTDDGSPAVAESTARPSSPTSKAWMPSTARGLLLVILAISPLPYGSASFGWTAVWAILAGLALVAALSARDRSGLSPYALGLILFVLALALHVGVTTAPWMPHVLWADVWSRARDAGVDVAGRISISAATPIEASGLPIAAAAAFLTAHVALNRTKPFETILSFALYAITVYAVVGGVQKAVAPDYVLFERKNAYVGLLTGPFVNRNTAATYFGIGTILATHMAHRTFRRLWIPGSKPPSILFAEITRLMVTKLPLRIALSLFLLTATLLTGSRAGAAAILVALFVQFKAGETPALDEEPTRLRTRILKALLAAATLFFIGHALAFRGAEHLFADGRFAVWRATIGAVADHPWFGTGLGTFAEAFPRWRPADIPSTGIWERAHSTPVALLSDLGVPMFLLAVGLWLDLGRRLLRATRARDTLKPVATTSLALWVLASIHGSVDFSFEIPAVALTFAILMGNATGLLWRAEATTAHALPHRHAHPSTTP